MFGNVWIGVQPLLGVEGDPMRMLFERDLTPHPQYVAFYKWLQNKHTKENEKEEEKEKEEGEGEGKGDVDGGGFGADAVVHFGTHGTVEWLPGSPLGNTGLSWSDVLLGCMPNVYVYTANNPSESIIAKRRGYGTIVSYNVPPYARAGLYNKLASLKEVLDEYRGTDPPNNIPLRAIIADTAHDAGLFRDVPWKEGQGEEEEEGQGGGEGGGGSRESKE